MLTTILQDRLSGEVILNSDQGFAAARDALIWNGRKPRQQAGIIVRPAHAADVQEAVRFAAQLGMKISPRGGGHQFSGVAARGQMIIDLGAMTKVVIDRERMTARVEPAATNLEMARLLAAEGLAFPLGHCGDVAMSGYLLGGGIGWNSVEWGMACASVEAVEVVLPDGQLVTANEREHADILWAARGAGARFFGVITAYHLRLQRAPGAILTTVRVYPTSAAGAVADWAERAMARAPRNVEFTAKVSAPPPGVPIAGKIISTLTTVFAASVEEGQAVLAEVGEGAPEALQVMEAMPTPLEVLYGLIAQSMPDGARYGVDAIWSDAPYAGVLETVAAAIDRVPSDTSEAIVALLPQASLPERASFSKLGRIFVGFYGIWHAPEADAENLTWLRGTVDSLQDRSIGSYIGYADMGRPGRQHATHSDVALARLTEMSRQYDPDGLFAGRVPDGPIA